MRESSAQTNETNNPTQQLQKNNTTTTLPPTPNTKLSDKRTRKTQSLSSTDGNSPETKSELVSVTKKLRVNDGSMATATNNAFAPLELLGDDEWTKVVRKHNTKTIPRNATQSNNTTHPPTPNNSSDHSGDSVNILQKNVKMPPINVFGQNIKDIINLIRNSLKI